MGKHNFFKNHFYNQFLLCTASQIVFTLSKKKKSSIFYSMNTLFKGNAKNV